MPCQRPVKNTTVAPKSPKAQNWEALGKALALRQPPFLHLLPIAFASREIKDMGPLLCMYMYEFEFFQVY